LPVTNRVAGEIPAIELSMLTGRRPAIAEKVPAARIELARNYWDRDDELRQ
jgi:hypothetical protein